MTSKNQSGFATLSVTMLLLFLGTLAVLTSSKVIFYEQKTATNEYHYGQASAAAKAGLARALTYLGNTKTTLPNKASLFDGATKRLKPAAFPIVEQLNASKSGFSVTMSQPSPVADPYLIQVTATGCADGCAPCTPDCGAQVIVTELVKLRKLVSNLPDAPLIARGAVDVGGSGNVLNTTPNGIFIRAGGIISANKVTGKMVGNDTILAATPPEDFFNYFFNDAKATVKGAIPNLSATFPPAGQGGAYWIEGNTAIHGGTYGSETEPVVLIVNGDLQINGGTTIYGLVYIIGGWSNSGGGDSNIHGAAISDASYSTVGNKTITFNQTVLDVIGATTAPARVIGSWKDF